MGRIGAHSRWHRIRYMGASVDRTQLERHVTIKKQHELIQNGPYATVRHLIYAGILLAILGTALVHGEVRAFLALPVAAIGWTFKLRTEESFMTQQFGAAYVDYKLVV